MEAAVIACGAALGPDIASFGYEPHGMGNGPAGATTLHGRNPILYGPREGADFVRCRSCDECLLILQREQPGILKRDIGVCILDMEAVDPDEKMAINERECWRARQF